ncbi:hypothetical protein AYO44_03235 [Planctomycetaceae bacterium SCGC AG-212-F19]|nr:hypothetical protein AYO44_03235 [Planctomycetaceae bacterium SCGC AG-212-F19]
MRLAHGRASWALAAAGSFTIALSSMAQQTSKPAALPTGHAEKPAPETDIPPAQGRLAEIKVELAWLGDQATFPCQLAARKVGGKLEVGGFVPNDILRTKAVDLARANCELPIVDKVVVHPGSAVPIVKATHDELSRAAAAVLGRALAQHAEDFQFETDGNGQITVRGLIPTWEDKLTISRRLSQLPGCTCVANQFRVRNQMRDGLVCNLISTDGKLRVPAPATAMVDIPPPKPIILPEVVQRVEVAGTVPLVPSATVAVVNAPAMAAPRAPVASAVARVLPAPAPVPSQAVAIRRDVSPPPAWPTANIPATASAKVTTPAVSAAMEATPVRKAVQAPAALASPYVGQTAASAPAAAIKQVSYDVPAQPARENRATTTAPAATPSSPYGGSPYGGSPYGGTAPAAKVTSAPAVTQPTVVVRSAPAKPTPTMPTPVLQPSVVQASYTERTPAMPTAPIQPVASAVRTPAPAKSPSNMPTPVVQPSGVVQASYTEKTSAMPTAPMQPVAMAPRAAAPAKPTSNMPTPIVQPSGVVQASYTEKTSAMPTAPAQPVASAVRTPAPVTQVAAATPVTPTPPRGWTTPTASSEARMESQVPNVLPANFVTAPMPTVRPAQPTARPAATPAVQPTGKPVPVNGILPVSASVPATEPHVSGPKSATPVTSPEVQKVLFQRIQKVGGAKVQDIRIQSRGGNDCVIHVTVKNAADGQEVGKKIIDMPELTPYKVDLQVHLSR